MAAGKNGSFVVSGQYGFFGQIIWSEEYDVATNASTLSIILQLKSTGYISASGNGYRSYYPHGTIKVGGNTALTMDANNLTHSLEFFAFDQWYDIRGNPSFPITYGPIYHNQDGEKTVSIAVDLNLITMDGQGGSGSKVSGSNEITLTPIPRKSEITSAAAVTLGKACSVRWTPLSDSFQYKLKFSLLDWSHTTDYIKPNTTSQYTYTGYTIPMEAANQLPNVTSGAMTVTLYTYNGSTVVGEASDTFDVTVPENADTRPTVADLVITAADSPIDGVFIQGNSKVHAAFTGTGKYGAEIASTKMTVEGKTYTDERISDYIGGYGDIKVTIAVTDTRGFTGTAEVTIYVCAYSKPKVKVSVCQRCDASGNADDGGTYLMIDASRIYSKVVSGTQHNFCTLRYRYAKQGETLPETWTTLLGANNSNDSVQTGALLGSLSKEAIYIVEVGVIDTVGNTSETSYTILTEAVFMHEKAGGNGLGLGMYCTADNRLDVAWDAHFHGEVNIGNVSLRDYILSVISEG